MSEERTENLTKGKKMAKTSTELLVSNMIEKYCEVFNNALRLGLDDDQAHAYTKNWFDAGFAYLRNEVA